MPSPWGLREQTAQWLNGMYRRMGAESWSAWLGDSWIIERKEGSGDGERAGGSRNKGNLEERSQHISGMSEFVMEIHAYSIILKTTTKLVAPWSRSSRFKILHGLFIACLFFLQAWNLSKIIHCSSICPCFQFDGIWGSGCVHMVLTEGSLLNE